METTHSDTYKLEEDEYRDDVLLVLLDMRRVEQLLKFAASRALDRGGNLLVVAACGLPFSWLNPVAELAGFPPISDAEEIVRAGVLSKVSALGVTARCICHSRQVEAEAAIFGFLEEGVCAEAVLAVGTRRRSTCRRGSKLALKMRRHCKVTQVTTSDTETSMDGAGRG